MADAADTTRIKQVSNGVPGGLTALVELFISHTTETARQLRVAADESRAAEVHMLAHRGVGTAGAFGAVRLTELFRKLDVLARQPQMEGVGDLLTELEAELARVHAFLSALIVESGTA